MMLRLILLTIALTVALSNIQPLDAQDQTAQPYLYYYSMLLGGLIIEHPDGTDSRQIAANIIPPNMSGLAGAGWSPSGKYFAAYGKEIAGYISKRRSPFVVDLQGQPAVNWFHTLAKTTSLQWSPSGDDILLVMGSYDPNQGTDFGTFVWLIDIESKQVLAEYGINVGMIAYAMSKITWDIPNRQIEFYLKPDTYNIGSYYHVTMNFDGTTHSEPTSAENFTSLADSYPNVEADYRDDGSSISPNGTFTTLGDYPAILTDTRTGNTLQLPKHTWSTGCREYRWSSDEQFMITLDGSLIAGGGCGVAVMGITDSRGQLWREIGSCLWGFEPCAGWLPENINIDALPAGSPKPVLLDPVKIDYISGDITFGVSRMEPLLFWLVCNKDATANIISIETGEIAYRLDFASCPGMSSRSPRPDKSLAVTVAEDPIHHLLATFIEREEGILISQLEGDQYKPVFRLNSQGFTLEFMNNYADLRARNFAGWKTYSVNEILDYAQSFQPK